MMCICDHFQRFTIAAWTRMAQIKPDLWTESLRWAYYMVIIYYAVNIMMESHDVNTSFRYLLTSWPSKFIRYRQFDCPISLKKWTPQSTILMQKHGDFPEVSIERCDACSLIPLSCHTKFHWWGATNLLFVTYLGYFRIPQHNQSFTVWWHLNLGRISAFLTTKGRRKTPITEASALPLTQC